MKKPTKKQLIFILTIAAVLAARYFILPVSTPLLLALVTAFLLDPIVRFSMKRFSCSRKMAVTFVFLLFIILLTFICYFIIVKSIGQLISFGERLPAYIIQINNQLDDWNAKLDNLSDDFPEQLVAEIRMQIQSTMNLIGHNIRATLNVEQITKLLGKIPEFLISLIVFMLALFMFMIEFPKLKVMIYNHLTDDTAKKVTLMSQRLKEVFFGFFKARFLLSSIVFLSAWAGLYIIVPEYALMIAFLLFIIDLLPIIGSIILLGPWSAYMFMTDNVLLGTQLLVLAVLLIAIRRITEPKIMGTQIGLSPLATLLSMYLGLKLLGVFGFIVGPVLVILFNTAKETGIIKTNFKV